MHLIELYKTVKKLRSQDLLNEKAWQYCKHNISRIHIGMLLLAALLGIIFYLKEGAFGAITIIALWIFCWFVVINNQLNYYLIYTFGKRTKAKVVWALSTYDLNIGIYDLHTYKFHYEVDGREYEVKFRPSSNKYAKEARPQIGDIIDVLYFKEYPEQALPYYQFMNNQFNLKRSSYV